MLPLLLILLTAFLAGCGDEDGSRTTREAPSEPRAPIEDDPNPPTARLRQARELAADRDAERHASDGGGSVVLERAEPERVEAMRPGTWTLVYTAGPLGVAEGGALHFLPDPFWSWSPPQARASDQPGYTEVTTEAEGVELELVAQRAGAGMSGALIARVTGAPLEEGDRVRIVYGAGRLGAFADRHAERESHLWIAVDGDGDGVRAVLEDSPTVRVLPGPVARVVLHGPSVAREGEEVRFTVALLDPMAAVVEDAVATVAVTQRPDGWDLPERVELRAEHRGARSFTGIAAGRGVARVAVELELEEDTLRAEANPLVVADGVPRVRWADLHGHSHVSDGTGTPREWWRYARDVARLDAAALTDHDHFGVRFLDDRPAVWEALQETARGFHEPGAFVALIGYEWTSWIHGHRHVLYFGEEGELHSSLDPRYETPRQLWNALEGRPALTVAHHSAGDPVPVNWSFRPPPELEPVTEVSSVHGSSEALDSPLLVRGAVKGNTVRDQLEDGLRLGFIGSGDGHDGHPGLAHLSPVYGWRSRGPTLGTGGLAAILSEDLTRDSLLEALRARRCYATSGPRILVDTTLDGHAMGATVEVAALESPRVELLLVGTAGLDWVDLVRPDRVERLELEGEGRFQGALSATELEPGQFLYLRVQQEDGGLAWTSPWFLE